jgi:hypothetical protein
MSITTTLAQEPIKDLSIGNSWTYRDSGYAHGGNHWDYYSSWKIIGDTIINNHTFSAYNIPINERSDSISIIRHWYCHSVGGYVTEVYCDFTMLPGDTLITTTGAIIMLSKGDSVFFGESHPYIKVKVTGCRYDFWTDHVLLISKKFGLVHHDANGIDLWFKIWLMGALIDGVLYGDTTVVGINSINSVPMHFALMQNYPNPFNPSTNITYSITELSFVTLIVFDVLGNEIATLVNEEKPIGNYTVDFTTTNLPSGIYFYQLQTPNFTQTKKMILLK